jgi:hypothetical protein
MSQPHQVAIAPRWIPEFRRLSAEAYVAAVVRGTLPRDDAALLGHDAYLIETNEGGREPLVHSSAERGRYVRVFVGRFSRYLYKSAKSLVAGRLPLPAYTGRALFPALKELKLDCVVFIVVELPTNVVRRAAFVDEVVAAAGSLSPAGMSSP